MFHKLGGIVSLGDLTHSSI